MTDPEAFPAASDASPALDERSIDPQLAALGETAKDYARNARAENTRRAYESDWRQFSSWLRRQGLPAEPPDPQIVGLYLAACANGKKGGASAVSVATLERRLSGICWRYRQLGEPLDQRSPHLHRAGRHPPRPWAAPPCRRRRSSPTICAR